MPDMTQSQCPRLSSLFYSPPDVIRSVDCFPHMLLCNSSHDPSALFCTNSKTNQSY